MLLSSKLIQSMFTQTSILLLYFCNAGDNFVCTKNTSICMLSASISTPGLPPISSSFSPPCGISDTVHVTQLSHVLPVDGRVKQSCCFFYNCVPAKPSVFSMYIDFMSRLPFRLKIESATTQTLLHLVSVI